MHTCILRLSAPELDWSQQPPPLSGLPEDVLGTILHFLYAECLPANLGEQTARDCIAAAASLPGLERLVRMCELYLKNTALKQRRFDFLYSIFQPNTSLFMEWLRNYPVSWNTEVVLMKAFHQSLYGVNWIYSFYKTCFNSILSYTLTPHMRSVSFFWCYIPKTLCTLLISFVHTTCSVHLSLLD